MSVMYTEAIGPGLHVHRPEERIGPEDELRAGIGVAKLGQPVGLDDLRATDQSAHGLGEQEIAAKILRKSIATDDIRAGRRREVVEGAERLADPPHPALHIADPRSRPHRVEARLETVVQRQAAVLDRELEVDRAALPTCIDEPHLPVVVRGQAPGGAVRGRRLAKDPVSVSNGSGTRCTCCRSSCPGPTGSRSARARRCRHGRRQHLSRRSLSCPRRHRCSCPSIEPRRRNASR